MQIPVLTLAPRQTHRCLAGHPWVFRSEFAALPEDLPANTAVRLEDHRNKLVGTGLYSAKSQIAVRLVSRQGLAPDGGLLDQRIGDAIARRLATPGIGPARRLINSEGDGLPGLIVDEYDTRLVVQATTAPMDARLPALLARLQQLRQPSQVILRHDLPVRALEGLDQTVRIVHGAEDGRVQVRIGALNVQVDLLDPHKTGAYLDQQANHLGFAQFVKPGDRIADVCCHLGGFALHGLLAGAAKAVGIDQAAASCAAATATAAANGLGDRFTAVEADAFAWLGQAAQAGERFDVIVLDPPSFTRNRAGAAQALTGYRDLHRRALKLLAPGGRLLTYSCSFHVPREEFLGTLTAAAADAHRDLRLLASQGPAADHPSDPGAPETDYLKGYAVAVE